MDGLKGYGHLSGRVLAYFRMGTCLFSKGTELCQLGETILHREGRPFLASAILISPRGRGCRSMGEEVLLLFVYVATRAVWF